MQKREKKNRISQTYNNTILYSINKNLFFPVDLNIPNENSSWWSCLCCFCRRNIAICLLKTPNICELKNWLDAFWIFVIHSAFYIWKFLGQFQWIKCKINVHIKWMGIFILVSENELFTSIEEKKNNYVVQSSRHNLSFFHWNNNAQHDLCKQRVYQAIFISVVMYYSNC